MLHLNSEIKGTGFVGDVPQNGLVCVSVSACTCGDVFETQESVVIVFLECVEGSLHPSYDV